MIRISGFCLLLSVLLSACGSGGEDHSLRQKAVKDSLRRVDSLAREKASEGARKTSLEDSVLEMEEYKRKLVIYDSLREVDSLKVKRKKHPPVKPAPKRQLDGKSPVK
ncbi:MAG TPA: hypothetical protein VI112_18240 [Bacteroidia bacterium]|jgi:hypothetical protein